MKFEHAAASLRHVCKHKELSWLIGYIGCQDPADDGSHSSWNINRIILMTDWNLERIMCL